MSSSTSGVSRPAQDAGGSARSARRLAASSANNQERILAQCPHVSAVRGFHAWLKAGRVVRKGQQGVKIIAPAMITSDGTRKVVTIKPAWVFDVTQTDERTPRAAA